MNGKTIAAENKCIVNQRKMSADLALLSRFLATHTLVGRYVCRRSILADQTKTV